MDPASAPPRAAPPPPASTADVPLLEPSAPERHKALSRVLQALSHAVAADGGSLHLVECDVFTGVVVLELSGACSSCALSSATLEQGVARIFADRLPWVTDLRYSVREQEEFITGTANWRPKE